MRVNANMTVELSVEQLAAGFCELDSNEQAEFFIAVARIIRQFPRGPGRYLNQQWYWIGNSLSAMADEDVKDVLCDMVKTMSKGSRQETQASIAAWADQTFGPVVSNLSSAVRANREMTELVECLTENDRHPKAASEAADVVIVLSRLVEHLGGHLPTLINEKMAKNRNRQWKPDGRGHGQHIKEEDE